MACHRYFTYLISHLLVYLWNTWNMDHKIYTSGGNQTIVSQIDHDCLKETKQIS